MTSNEFLAGYGLRGDFARFRSLRPLSCRRGDRIVVRSHRGLEIAWVLRPAGERHAQFLPNTTLGQVLRVATAHDEELAAQQQEVAQRLLSRGTQLVEELGLPLELLDAEVLLDGEHGVLHHLRWDSADVRPLVSTLSRELAVTLTLEDLGRPQEALEEAAEHAGCGREGCGSGEGGCGSCSSGGCSSCGVAGGKETQAYFSGLREQMEQRRQSLL